MSLDPINNMYYLAIDKSQIDSSDFTDILGFCKKIFEQPELYRGSVDFYVSGYIEDPRELYEIPEVCSYLSALNTKFPFWFYFLTTNGQGLKILRMCQVFKEKINIHQFRQDDDKVIKFFELNFGGMNHLCEKLGYSEDEIEDLSNRIFEYYKKSPLNPDSSIDNHLPGAPIQ